MYYIKKAEQSKYEFRKSDEQAPYWWVFTPDMLGECAITFDKETVYNLWADYRLLTEEQARVFKQHDAYWYKFLWKGSKD